MECDRWSRTARVEYGDFFLRSFNEDLRMQSEEHAKTGEAGSNARRHYTPPSITRLPFPQTRTSTPGSKSDSEYPENAYYSSDN